MRYGDAVTTAYITKRLAIITKMLNELNTRNFGILNTANFVGEWSPGGELIEPMDVNTEQFCEKNVLKTGLSTNGPYSFLYEFKKDIDELTNR